MKIVATSFALLLVTAAPLSAQPAPLDPAEVAYQEGLRFYDLREWDKAIERFKEAYRLRPDAVSLFNVAQAYRLKGDCVEAIGFYKTYKRNFPTAANIDKVNKFLVDLEPCAQQQASTAKLTPTEPAGPTPDAGHSTSTSSTKPVTTGPSNEPHPAKPEPRFADEGGGKRLSGLVLGGAGLALVGTGFLFGKAARQKSDAISDGDGTATWDPDLTTQGKRYDLLAKISWGVGGAAVLGGVVLYALGKRAERTPVTVAVTDGGATLVWTVQSP